jgi:hypothetical protein
MHLKRVIGSGVAVVAMSAAVLLYTVHGAKSSDHQDTFNLTNRSNTSADITDVYVYPAPDNPSQNVVFVIDTTPLIPAGMGTAKFFDPTLLYQIKMSHGAPSSPEDEVIQFTASGTGSGQTINVYGPGKPNEVGTTNTTIALSGTIPYNNTAGTTFSSNSVKAFAGPRADPFNFDLFQFFTFLGNRSAAIQTSQSSNLYANSLTDTKGNPATAPSFNGFAAGTTSGAGGKGYACSTAPAVDALTDINGGFNVLSLVVEVPRTLLTTGYSSSALNVWATVSSSTGS